MAGPRRVPLRFQANCEFCGDELDIRRAGVHQFTSGWVPKRKEGGGNMIAVPHREMRFACQHCIDRESRGGAVYQPALFSG